MTNGRAPLAAVLVNGGTGRPVAGTWSATSEVLARELSPRFTGIQFVEVRYRIKSWKALERCTEDAAAAVELAVAGGAQRCLLIGFSMGGAVSIGGAGHDSVTGVLGLSPWIPGRLSLDGLLGKRLDVLQGGLDRGVAGHTGNQPGELARRLRTRAGARCRGHVRDRPRRVARLRRPRAVRNAAPAAALAGVGGGRRRSRWGGFRPRRRAVCA